MDQTWFLTDSLPHVSLRIGARNSPLGHFNECRPIARPKKYPLRLRHRFCLVAMESLALDHLCQEARRAIVDNGHSRGGGVGLRLFEMGIRTVNRCVVFLRSPSTTQSGRSRFWRYFLGGGRIVEFELHGWRLFVDTVPLQFAEPLSEPPHRPVVCEQPRREHSASPSTGSAVATPPKSRPRFCCHL